MSEQRSALALRLDQLRTQVGNTGNNSNKDTAAATLAAFGSSAAATLLQQTVTAAAEAASVTAATTSTGAAAATTATSLVQREQQEELQILGHLEALNLTTLSKDVLFQVLWGGVGWLERYLCYLFVPQGCSVSVRGVWGEYVCHVIITGYLPVSSLLLSRSHIVACAFNWEPNTLQCNK